MNILIRFRLPLATLSCSVARFCEWKREHRVKCNYHLFKPSSICCGCSWFPTVANVILNNYFPFNDVNYHVKWVPCHQGMARPWVTDGGDDFHRWKVAVSMLAKQSQRVDKGGLPPWGLGVVPATLHHKKIILLRDVTQGLRLVRFLG
jgi:hypothetical protein